MALTASSPAYRGYLSEVDCRWNVLCATLDDRTEEEAGLKVGSFKAPTYHDNLPRNCPQPLKNNKHVIPKSRYSSVDMYISPDSKNKPEYNDIPVPFDEHIYNRLRQNSMSHRSLLLSPQPQACISQTSMISSPNTLPTSSSAILSVSFPTLPKSPTPTPPNISTVSKAPPGNLCGSSPRLVQTARLGGALKLGRWRCNRRILRMRRLRCLLRCWRGRLSGWDWKALFTCQSGRWMRTWRGHRRGTRSVVKGFGSGET
jgi:hypothetical protein